MEEPGLPTVLESVYPAAPFALTVHESRIGLLMCAWYIFVAPFVILSIPDARELEPTHIVVYVVFGVCFVYVICSTLYSVICVVKATQSVYEIQ